MLKNCLIFCIFILRALRYVTTTQVKHWITHNEPYETCWSAYGLGEDAPGFKDNPGTYPYRCAHNLIKSHAAVWHMYDKEFRPTQKGKTLIVCACMLQLQANALRQVKWESRLMWNGKNRKHLLMLKLPTGACSLCWAGSLTPSIWMATTRWL